LSSFVLDASALLAYLNDESGAAVVEEALAATGVISAANLAEALSKIAERGGDCRAVVRELEQEGILGDLLEVEPLTTDDALAIAELRPVTRLHGFGLADRACLALGRRLGLPVITADTGWTQLPPAVGVRVQAIR
jgi:PIN domain nuclease of toxin-antitoxin system